jgi:hypothetical protein
MKRFLTLFILAISTFTAVAQSQMLEQWWSYLAAYDAGPGSIRLNLALRKQAPSADYPHLVITGTTYVSTERQGLPEASDFDRLNAIQERVISTIEKQTPLIYAGTFTHNFEQLHYIYVKNPEGVSAALNELYREVCKDCKAYTNIKPDPSWSAYTDFLFPNKATRDFYGLQIK